LVLSQPTSPSCCNAVTVKFAMEEGIRVIPKSQIPLKV
ncbi:unnamed protein product, partial [Brassica rapa subsp. trilocularis]